MASLSSLLHWLSGLTIVACNCGGQKSFAAPENCLLSHQMVSIVKMNRCYKILAWLQYIKASKLALCIHRENSILQSPDLFLYVHFCVRF